MQQAISCAGNGYLFARRATADAQSKMNGQRRFERSPDLVHSATAASIEQDERRTRGQFRPNWPSRRQPYRGLQESHSSRLRVISRSMSGAGATRRLAATTYRDQRDVGVFAPVRPVAGRCRPDQARSSINQRMSAWRTARRAPQARRMAFLKPDRTQQGRTWN